MLAAMKHEAFVEPIPPAEIPEIHQHLDLRSGLLTLDESALASQTHVVYNQTLYADNPEAPWMFVEFDETTSISPSDVDACTLKMWSLEDEQPQLLNAHTLEQWSFRSAFFNGAAVQVQLLCTGDAPSSRVDITGVTAGEPMGPSVQTGYCERSERRTVPNAAKRGARYRIAGGGGCSVWLITDPQKCFLTAGHCGRTAGGTAEFNVPPSNSDGSIVSPGPQDQYTFDTDSLQYTFIGVGTDWKYIGAFPNSNTGRTAYETQGDAYDYISSSSQVPSVGTTIHHLGHGSSVVGTFSQTYKGTKDDLRSVAANSLTYRVDTTPGDSGSSVSYGQPHDADGTSKLAIAIATHAGCRSSSNSNTQVNYGTNLSTGPLQNALAAPRGVCSNQGAKEAGNARYGVHFRGDANHPSGPKVSFQ